MLMKYFLKVNRNANIAFIFSVGFSILFLYYQIPWGLMDDYKWIVRTQEFIEEPIKEYIEFQKDWIGKGTLQPFIQLQFIFQYLPGIYLGSLFTYIQNIFIIFFTHYYLFKIFEKKLEIKYIDSLSVFMIYPYTFDMFLLPSLQEKFSVPLFTYLLYTLEKNKEFNKNKHIFIFFLSLSIPFIKLQGSVFIFFIIFYWFLNRTKDSLISILGFILAILIQGYILFFIDSGYYVVDNTISQIFENLFSLQNLFFLLVILTSLLFAIFEKNNEKKFFITGLAFSGASLQFIYLNWETYGYLLSFYSFFLSLLVPYCVCFVLNKLNIKLFYKLSTFSLVVLMVVSSYLFFLPRIERWSDLNTVYITLDEVNLDQSVYYCGSEGVLTFNNLNNNINEVKFAGNFDDIEENNFYFITDDLQCSYLEEFLNNTCIIQDGYESKYRRVQINKYSC